MNTTANITRTHARRQQAVGTGLQQATLALRRLAGTSTPPSIAKATRDRYCRAIGVPAGAGGDAAIRFLLSADAARLSIEDIDARLFGWN